MINEINEIILEFKQICLENDLEITDGELLSEATREYHARQINRFKELPKNNSQTNQSRSPFVEKFDKKASSDSCFSSSDSGTNNDKPTEKQIWRLKQLKIAIPKELTKKEAIKLIKENSI
jgi:hypothetical protein